MYVCWQAGHWNVLCVRVYAAVSVSWISRIIYICICMYIHIYIYIYIYMHICAYIYCFMYMYISLSLSIYIHFCLSLSMLVDWTSHVTHMNAACHTSEGVTHKSVKKCRFVSRQTDSTGYFTDITADIWMQHVTRMGEWGMKASSDIGKSVQASGSWNSRGSHQNDELCHICQCRHMNTACHTCGWVRHGWVLRS